ncbi:unnamed protein product [Amoebophrya sp. A25]|nr:unnamed protein product [Amoebophrya sp. A25]|eukprot:GSA25T00024256001.1
MVLHDKTKHVPFERQPWFKRKERQSGDIKSSINAPAKKNGQGGSFTYFGTSLEEEQLMQHDGAQQMMGSFNKSASEPSSASSSFIEEKDFRFSAADFPPLGLGSMKGSPKATAMKERQASQWIRNVLVDKSLGI